MTLVMVLISAMIAVPLLRYTATVAKQNQVVRQRTIHIEAVKGALRASLAQPKALFQACGSAGLTTGVLLGSASLTTPVETKCFKLSAQGAIDTANAGRRCTKLTVPSSGSRNQRGRSSSRACATQGIAMTAGRDPRHRAALARRQAAFDADVAVHAIAEIEAHPIDPDRHTTPELLARRTALVALAARTNHLATGLQVPLDPAFDAGA